MFRTVEIYPLPVVAAAHGHAIAGGAELVFHCDFVVASRAARFGMSLAQIGLASTWFLTKKIIEVAGPVTAWEILLLGNPVSSEKLHELGVIARAVPERDLEVELTSITNRLARNAPKSLEVMKALMLRQMEFRDGIPHDDLLGWRASVKPMTRGREWRPD